MGGRQGSFIKNGVHTLRRLSLSVSSPKHKWQVLAFKFFLLQKIARKLQIAKVGPDRRAPLVFTSFHLLFCVIPEWNRFRDTECDRRQKGPLPPHRRRGEARMQASCMATAFPIKFRSRPLILDRTEEAGQGAIH